MLASSLKFVKAFDQLDDEDGHYQRYFKDDGNEPKRIEPPRFEDWENAKLYECYSALYNGGGGDGGGDGGGVEVPSFCDLQSDDSSMFDLSTAFTETVENEDNIMCKNEVDRYLLEPVECKRSNFDVLNW
ncbi:hypothetical protein LWI29_016375 [Acer saccharum]|uniref:Uncharacterized protein n=1 Tax=Acer saccharum TaxID=4024 RepID=A0AA39W2K4_ACESA|nr:hypothetical protein LWI29_016375 [Acer saccharum]